MLELLQEAKNEIVGGLVVALVLAVLGGVYSWFRAFIRKYRKMKLELERMREEMTQLGATKEEFDHLNESLRVTERKSQEDSQRIEELRSQVKALQQELELEKAKKKFPAMSDEDFVELCGSSVKQIEEAIKNGANVNAKNNNGDTPLFMAAAYDNVVLAELLLKHGADVNTRVDYGYTALIMAAENGSYMTADILLEHGADVNAQTNDGDTALITAIREEYMYIAELLLKHGANVNTKNNDGWTALTWATKKGHTEIANLLRSYGAK